MTDQPHAADSHLPRRLLIPPCRRNGGKAAHVEPFRPDPSEWYPRGAITTVTCLLCGDVDMLRIADTDTVPDERYVWRVKPAAEEPTSATPPVPS